MSISAPEKPKSDPRRGSQSNGRRHRRRWLIMGCVLLLALGIAYAAGSVWLNHFINDGQLCQLLGRRTAATLGAESAGYLPLSWRGLSVRSGGVVVRGKNGNGLAGLCATNIRARCSLLGLVRRRWQVNEVRADHLQAAFGSAAAKLLKPDLAEMPVLEPAEDSVSILKVDIRKTSVARTDVSWGENEKSIGTLRDVVTEYYPRDKDLDVQAHGGTFRQTSWPEFQVRQIGVHYGKKKLEIRSAEFALGEGKLSAQGELDFGAAQRMNLRLQGSQSPIAPYLSGKWSGKADGVFDGQATIEKGFGPGGTVHAQGWMRATKASLHGWPALDKLALVTRKAEFRKLPISEFKADYALEGKRLEVAKLRAESPGLVCVEGKFRLENETIEATFEVGASASVLESIPGARAEVFTSAHDGYFWTTMHLSGPISHPREDLKERLVAAAEKHLTEGIIGMLFKPGKAVLELLQSVY